MTTKTVLKIFLDIVMTICFVLLMNLPVTGLVFHELAGIAAFLFIVIHLILNFSWLKGVTTNTFLNKNETNTKTKIMYALNIGLFVSIILIVVTGIIISKYLFPSTSHSQFVTLIHKGASFVALGLIVAHVALHLKYLRVAFKNIFTHFGDKNVKKAFAGCFIGLAVLIALYVPLSKYLSTNSQADFAVGNAPSGKTAPISSGEPPQNSKNRKDTTSTDDNSNSKDTTDNSSITEDTIDQSASLSDYLDNLTCTGCGKRCSLLSPQCGKGEDQAEKATTQYESASSTQ